MIAANYTINLYCDCKKCSEAFRPVEGEFIAESWSQAAKQARKLGWRISTDRTRCFGPDCKIRRID